MTLMTWVAQWCSRSKLQRPRFDPDLQCCLCGICTCDHALPPGPPVSSHILGMHVGRLVGHCKLYRVCGCEGESGTKSVASWFIFRWQHMFVMKYNVSFLQRISCISQSQRDIWHRNRPFSRCSPLWVPTAHFHYSYMNSTFYSPDTPINSLQFRPLLLFLSYLSSL